MLLHKGRLFIEAKSITGIKTTTLKQNLVRARKKSQESDWYNEANPNYNGSNSKRIVLVDALPASIKDKVLADFKTDIQKLQQGFQEAKTHGEDVVTFVSEATAQVVDAGEQFVQMDIIQYVDTYYHKYTAHYIELGIPDTRQVIRYARTCALAMKVWESIGNIDTQNRKLYKTTLRSMMLNITNALAGSHLNVYVPNSDARLSQWLHKCVDAMLNNRTIYELVEVKNIGNKNREKFTEEQKNFANSLRTSARSITSIYNELLTIAKEKSWWTSKGNFSPIHITSLQRHFLSVDNLLAKQRNGYASFINLNLPAISRTVPELKNLQWGIDGSPLDLMIYDTKTGKVSQNMNSIRIYDYATASLIGIYCYKGGGESFPAIMEAIKDAVKYTGHLPKTLNFDNGPASLELQQWCQENNVTAITASKGNARAKLIEQLLGQFSIILKEHPAYNGQNRSARGRNSVLSPEALMQAQKHADSFERTEQWLRNQAREQWNNRIMETFGRKPCGKSPNQLYNEKQSATEKLSEQLMAKYGGHAHKVRLTIDGLTIQNNGISYTYFPNIFTQNGFNKGVEIFSQTPIKYAPERGKLFVEVKFYGDEEAYIYNHNHKYLDTWILKPTVSMVATYESDTHKLKTMQAFQHAIKELATDIIARGKEVANILSIENNEQREIFNPLNKEILHAQEMSVEDSPKNYDELSYINPYTGDTEIIKQFKTA